MSSELQGTNDEDTAATRPRNNDRTVAELPFLVTHWLAHYGERREASESQDRPNQDALLRIRRAASEIASAFSELGAYGTASHAGLAGREELDTDRNVLFSDVARRWPALPTRHLENVVRSSASNTAALQSAAHESIPSSSIVEYAIEARAKSTTADGGRRLGSATENDSQEQEDVTPLVVSALHPPTTVASSHQNEDLQLDKVTKSNKKETLSQQQLELLVESDYRRTTQRACEAMRRLLSLRQKQTKEEKELIQLDQSLEKQREIERQLREEHQRVSHGIVNTLPVGPLELAHSTLTRTASAVASKELEAKLMDISTRKISCERVTAHILKRQTELVESLGRKGDEQSSALEDAMSICKASVVARWEQRDLFQQNPSSTLTAPLSHFGLTKLHALQSVASRQYTGGTWNPAGSSLRRFGRPPNKVAANRGRRGITSQKFSHAVTVNAHLTYPVYCQCFDRTGRFFVTGADDYLVKLFRSGPTGSKQALDEESRKVRCIFDEDGRRPVLVCTLRGHAGVICDIDVSVDNALLATASEDGDCRIWGLKDGCPVAILRGHAGGANMVSWSTLTPYRLTTIASDGFARIWDVRDAALKRYGAIVGKRVDYTLPIAETGRERNADAVDSSAVVLPPLPQRENAPTTGQRFPETNGEPGNAAVIPPLPPAAAVPPLPPRGASNNGNANNDAGENVPAELQNEIMEGSFVAGNAIDEGVRLIAQLQHGEVIEDNQHGPSTRSRRKAVKVICVSRCPLGGHFVTGSDDGMGRIWADMDDYRVEVLDKKYGSRSAKLDTLNARESVFVRPLRSRGGDSNDLSNPSLLATLAGHVNAITDLSYSHSGDRILTASQKDGVVRIWSWGSEAVADEHVAGASGQNASKFSDMRQILIKLTHPARERSVPSAGSQTSARRRATGGQSGASISTCNVHCDVAVWSSDDSKIITSQGCPSKPGTSDIVPGSQFLLIWDSRSGRCLMGIANAHSETCNVLVPHPTDSSILCSAGADGRVKIWDLDIGGCIVTHQNSVDHGPVEPASDRGKKSGYLDGSFSPDGLRLVLTDDSGRFTVLDTLKRNEHIQSDSHSGIADNRSFACSWTKEQYFANDYYELHYDANGYCIEKGSQLPPHLAPRAARCSHAGTPCPDVISRAFNRLVGPFPLTEQECRWDREVIRSKAKRLRMDRVPLVETAKEVRTIIVAEFDADRTILLNSNVKVVSSQITEKNDGQRERPSVNQRSTSTRGSRQLSTNYQWRDYDDLLREDDGINEEESDDEDFVAVTHQTAAQVGSSDDDSSLDGVDDASEDSREYSPSARLRVSARSRRMERRRRDREHSLEYDRQTVSQATRSSSRQQRRDTLSGPYHESESDDDIDEFLSTNNTPSGPYVEDYSSAGHFFRLPDSGIVKRLWLRRVESRSSYMGTKTYVPQVGDSVVYIPRAHCDTIKSFPSLKPPWQEWPRSSAWPVVRCSIRKIRYRFPFESYYKSGGGAQCISIVAILTLDVTGIPEISQDRMFPWPKPRFVARNSNTRSSNITFEVSLFEGLDADFVIPEQLYRWRLETLESAIKDRGEAFEGLPVLTYFQPDDSAGEDSTMERYRAQLVRVANKRENVSDNVRGSGYDALEVQWPDSETSFMSPWEMVVEERAKLCPPPPCISEAGKKNIKGILRSLEERDGVQNWFLHPVDERRYSDYPNRVEVPMDMSFIRHRLETGYYSNKLSVLSDVKLIRDNCIKYNGAASEVSQSAMEMYEYAKCEIYKLNDSDQEASLEGNQSHQLHEDARSSRRSRSTRSRLPSGLGGATSLENLPPPVSVGAVSVSQSSSQAGPSHESRRTTRSSQALSRESVLAVSGRSTRSSGLSQDVVVEDEPSHSDNSSFVDSSCEDDQISDGETGQFSDEGSHRSGDNPPSVEEKTSAERLRSRSRARQGRIAQPVAVRSSPRRRAMKNYSYVEVASDDEEYESASNGEELSEEEPEMLEGGETDTSESPAAASPRRSMRTRTAVIRSSPRSASRAPVKRKAVSAQTNAAKRRKVSELRTKRQPPKPTQSELKRWPEIDIRAITPVANAFLERMMTADEDGIFAAPVAETYPDIAPAYLEAIETPMDYRTILEDRIPAYQHIVELQDDLLLVFDNCIKFNKPNSQIGKIATAMKEMVNDTFRDVCKEQNVLLPRRW